jgi:hypothetical protein
MHACTHVDACTGGCGRPLRTPTHANTHRSPCQGATQDSGLAGPSRRRPPVQMMMMSFICPCRNKKYRVGCFVLCVCGCHDACGNNSRQRRAVESCPRNAMLCPVRNVCTQRGKSEGEGQSAHRWRRDRMWPRRRVRP